MRCPKCNLNLCGSLLDTTYQCEGNADGSCTFAIGKEKFDKLVDGMYTKLPAKFQTDDDRLSELNNLGRNFEREGYDQPND